MEPKEFDIEFPRGDTCPLLFELSDLNGNSLNMESAEIYFTVKKNYNSSEYIFQKKYSRGEIELEGIEGKLVISHSDTANLKYGRYVYDLQLKDGEYVKTLLKGSITLSNESTHLINE